MRYSLSEHFPQFFGSGFPCKPCDIQSGQGHGSIYNEVEVSSITVVSLSTINSVISEYYVLQVIWCSLTIYQIVIGSQCHSVVVPWCHSVTMTVSLTLTPPVTFVSIGSIFHHLPTKTDLTHLLQETDVPHLDTDSGLFLRIPWLKWLFSTTRDQNGPNLVISHVWLPYFPVLLNPLLRIVREVCAAPWWTDPVPAGHPILFTQ